MAYERIAFVAAPTPEAAEARVRLARLYGNVGVDEADVIVALGGDGMMLHTVHDLMYKDVPIYGMNRGSVGFMMNEYAEEGLPERLAKAEVIKLHPLRMEATDTEGRVHDHLAINEVSLLRETRQAARIRIIVDGVARLDEMMCDGVLVATNRDHVPNIASRLWIAAWFPRDWAGTPQFDESEVVVDWVRITPFNEDGDEWTRILCPRLSSLARPCWIFPILESPRAAWAHYATLSKAPPP